MNSLSWILYLADVLTNLSFVFVFLGSVCFLAISICWLVWSSDSQRKEEPPHRVFGSIVLASLFSLLVGLLVPEKTTFYLIAASEFGEIAVHTEEVSKILESVHMYIMHQLEVPTKD